MDDLVQWLRAQLDEDERIARAVPGPAWEHRQIRGDFDESVVFEDYIAVADPERNVVVFSDVSTEEAAFALRLDPARVLREIDAKSRIVRLHARAHHQCVAEDGPTQWHATDPCATLRLLALPYADRPGYREAWRP